MCTLGNPARDIGFPVTKGVMTIWHIPQHHRGTSHIAVSDVYPLGADAERTLLIDGATWKKGEEELLQLVKQEGVDHKQDVVLQRCENHKELYGKTRATTESRVVISVLWRSGAGQEDVSMYIRYKKPTVV